MRRAPIEPFLDHVVRALGRSALFGALDPQALDRVARRASLVQADAGDALIRQGDPADAFFVLLKGNARVLAEGPEGAVEVARVAAPDPVGEVGLLLGEPRAATVEALDAVIAARYEAEVFEDLFDEVPGFGLAVCRALATRSARTTQQIPLPSHPSDAPPPPAEVLRLLPAPFLARQRVLPLAIEGDVLSLGVIDDPTPRLLDAVRKALPGVTVRPVRVDPAWLDEVLQGRAGASGRRGDSGSTATFATIDPSRAKGRVDLRGLLERAVAEGASDLHLGAGQRPRWRVDGQIRELADLPILGATEVAELIETLAGAEGRVNADTRDADFAVALPGVARFRVNAYRDQGGVSAALRQIPERVLSFDQLGLPQVLRGLCDLSRGLVLITGGTGSGKSTTLAAMIDHINRTRPVHVLTMEDPIEFVHASQRALVNQREVGQHTDSFAKALRAALREDPDVVLVGEMRDLETIALALEVANTGHLVFGTLHTNTAVGTVDRVVSQFPSDRQAQVRAGLADTLKGIACQALCRRAGGGRIAAFETLVVNHGVANTIREGKVHQIPNLMVTGRAQGNRLMVDHLEELVKGGQVEVAEALRHAPDRAELARRLGV